MFQNISSIIGANGSGKSNVIASILFVFGYQLTKDISTFLHKSIQNEGVRQCSVTINFVYIQDDVIIIILLLFLDKFIFKLQYF